MVIRVNGKLISEPSGLRPATIVVAAYDSKDSTRADFVCPATDSLDFITDTVIPALPTSGGTILLLDGTYTMNTDNSGIVFDRNGIVIKGQGHSTEIKSASASVDGKLINTYQYDDWVIEDVRITGNESATTNYGVYLGDEGYSNYNGVINRVIFENCKVGIQVNTRSARGHVHDCQFYNCTNGFMGAYAYEWVIDGCFFYCPNGYTINATVPSWNYGKNRITNNFIQGYYNYFYLAEVIGNSFVSEGSVSFMACNVTNNYFGMGRGSAYKGSITILGTGSAGFETTFTGNQIENPGYRDAYQYWGVLVHGTASHESVIVRDNTFTASTYVKANVCVGSSCYGITEVAGNVATSPPYALDFQDLSPFVVNDKAWFDLATDTYVNIAANNSGAVDTVVLTSGTPVAITLTASDQPDVPRNLTLNLRDPNASISGIAISVTGYDAKGTVWTDSYTTASGATSRAWSTLVSASVTSVYGSSSGDVLYVGWGSKLGLTGKIAMSSDVIQVTRDGIPITTSGYSVNASYDTVDISGLTLGTDIVVNYRANRNDLYRV